jgi:RND family efflux transporter MFP subunit
MLDPTHHDQPEAETEPAVEEDAGPSNRTLKRVAIGAAVVALVIVGYGIFSRTHSVSNLRESAAQAAIPTVSVVAPKPDASGGALVLPGNVQAYNSAQIYARTSGYVRKWLVDIGDHVTAGQTLAILDAPEVEQQLDQAEADYQTALANQALAATTAKRWNMLLAKDAVSQQETDEKRGDLAAKAATSNSALANVRRLKAELGFARLTAPFAGVVSSRSTQIGALIVAGSTSSQPLFTVSDVSRMRVYVRVPQNYSAMVAPGLGAHITLPEYPGRVFVAVVTRSAQAVDAQSGSVLVELLAPNPDGALKPGAYASVRFDALNNKGSAYQLPGSAILYGNRGATVAVADPHGMVSVKPVTIARDDGATVVLSGGVAPTDRVIDAPPDSIRTGDQVRVRQSVAAKGDADNGSSDNGSADNGGARNAGAAKGEGDAR